MRSILLTAAMLLSTAIFIVEVPVEAAAQGSGYCMCRSKTHPNIASCKPRKVCHGYQHCTGPCFTK